MLRDCGHSCFYKGPLWQGCVNIDMCTDVTVSGKYSQLCIDANEAEQWLESCRAYRVIPAPAPSVAQLELQQREGTGIQPKPVGSALNSDSY